MVIELTASRACFNMRYLEVTQDDTAVSSNSEEQLYFHKRDIFLVREDVKLSTLVHSCMVGYSPKDSPRPVLPTVSHARTDQTKENYRCELISLSRARVETEMTSDSVKHLSESSESIFD